MMSSFIGKNFYFGSTFNINRRTSGYKNDYKRHLKGKFPYMTAFDVMKHDDWKIEIVDTLPGNSRKELAKLEGKWQLSIPDCVNQNIAGGKNR